MDGETSFKFSFAFDDESHSYSSLKGIGIDKLSRLLSAFAAIVGSEDVGEITLSNVYDKCQAYSISGLRAANHTQLVVAHLNVTKSDPADLTPPEKRLKFALKSTIPRGGVYLAIDNNENVINEINAKDLIATYSHYYKIASIKAVISGIGDSTLKRSYLQIPSINYKIKITPQQDLELRDAYRAKPVLLRIKQKVSIANDHVSSAELLEHEPLKGSLLENLMILKRDGLYNEFDSNEEILRYLNE